jgi:hypothetical protein
MSDEPKKRSRVWIVWAIVATLCLAYPLSMGPAVRYADLGSNVLRLYDPLERCCQLWQPLENLKAWYTEIWGARYQSDPNGDYRDRVRFSD